MAADAVLQETIPVAAITTVTTVDVVTDVALPFGAATTAVSGLFYCFCSAVAATMVVAAVTDVAVACLAVTATAAVIGLSGLS